MSTATQLKDLMDLDGGKSNIISFFKKPSLNGIKELFSSKEVKLTVSVNHEKMIKEAKELVDFIKKNNKDTVTPSEKDFLTRMEERLNKGECSEVQCVHLLKIRNRIMFGTSGKAKSLSEQEIIDIEKDFTVSEIKEALKFLRTNISKISDRDLVFLKTLKNADIKQLEERTIKRILEVRSKVFKSTEETLSEESLRLLDIEDIIETLNDNSPLLKEEDLKFLDSLKDLESKDLKEDTVLKLVELKNSIL